jgi:ABC-type bacteriocin/lantibiotic exporter with double-glycine peptidase domain
MALINFARNVFVDIEFKVDHLYNSIIIIFIMSLINWKLAFIAFLLVGVSMSGTCWKCSDIMGS